MKRTFLLLAAVALSGCVANAQGFERKSPFPSGEVTPTKPPLPVGPPAVLQPGKNVWVNPDGTVTVVWNDSGMGK